MAMIDYICTENRQPKHIKIPIYVKINLKNKKQLSLSSPQKEPWDPMNKKLICFCWKLSIMVFGFSTTSNHL